MALQSSFLPIEAGSGDAEISASFGNVTNLLGMLKNTQLTAYPSREFVDAGGLLSYGPSYPDLYRRAGGMIDKILKGGKAGEIPVEQPTKLELVINLRTAKAQGAVVPPQVLTTADEVLE